MEQRFHFESVRAFPFVLELTIGMLRLRSYYEIVWDSCDLTSFHLTYFTLALDQIVKSKTALNISPIILHKKNYFNKLNSNFFTLLSLLTSIILYKNFQYWNHDVHSRHIISKALRNCHYSNTSELHRANYHPNSSIHRKRSIKPVNAWAWIGSVALTSLVYYALYALHTIHSYK